MAKSNRISNYNNNRAKIISEASFSSVYFVHVISVYVKIMYETNINTVYRGT